MIYLWLANGVLLFHLSFILFVVLGGLLLLHRPKLAWMHVPAVLWGMYSEYFGVVCPLTPLENALRRLGGGTAYGGGFIEHYLTLVIYPEGLTREIQIALGTFVLLINIALYWRLAIICRRKRKQRT